MAFNIGIDFNGVLFNHHHGVGLVAAENSCDVLHKLKQMGCNLFVISACGEKKAQKRNKYLDCYKQLITNQYYVKGRDNKGIVCNDLMCHFVIDDNIVVLNNIKKHNNKIITILFCSKKNTTTNKIKNDSHVVVDDWMDILELVKETEHFNLEVLPITQPDGFSPVVY